LNKLVLVFAIIVIFYSLFLFFSSVNYDDLLVKEYETDDIIDSNTSFIPISNTDRCKELFYDVYNETHCVKYD
jgi:hypothetical protein